jgi:hypothetical protein
MNARNQQLVAMLMVVALIGSVLPRSLQSRLAAGLGFMVAPAMWPIRSLAEDAREPEIPVAPALAGADVEMLRREVDRLKVQVVALEGRLGEYQRREGAGEQFGAVLQSRLQPARVSGPAGSGRGQLRLGRVGSTVLEDAVVLTDAGIVGRVQTVAPGGVSAIVRTVTDRGFKLTASFVRVEQTPGQELVTMRLPIDPRTVEGFDAASNEMSVDGLTWNEVKDGGLKPGDWAVLDTDRGNWDRIFAGQRVGVVSYVAERIGQPGFAEVRIKPVVDLMTLRSVWVDAGVGR